MSNTLFILGKDRELSLAELKARYSDGLMEACGSDFAVLELSRKISQSEFNQLGGVVKAGKVLCECEQSELLLTLFNALTEDYEEGKLNYGVSLYGWPQKNLRGLLLSLKKKLKDAGVNSRFANQEFLNLSAAQYKGIRKNGIELLVAKSDSCFYIARTVSVQDIDAYSKRDYDKPFRDMKVGMLPPKLAQIMINLAGDCRTIWDPFCGGGVLLMEGLLMGRNMLGSDVNDTVLQGAWKNLEWLKQEFGFESDFELFSHDATRLVPSDRKFDAIVCEGYLGPPQSRPRSLSHLRPIIEELDQLYVRFFTTVKKSGFAGPIVIALPFFRCSNGQDVSLEQTVRQIERMGFRLKIAPLKYAREDQVVGREIYNFQYPNRYQIDIK